MGGRKHRRNTVKTGDKAQKRNASTSHTENTIDDDPIYDAVDRFHSQDYLRLDQALDDDEEDEEDDWGEEAVMDLGVDDEEEDDNDDSSTDDEEEEVSLSDDDNLQDEEDNVRNWGSRKSAYYHGDTADLEIGQDQDDAVLEEAAAKEVLAARFLDMKEDDFVVSSDEDETPAISDVTASTMSQRNLLQLSIKEKQRLLNKQHPEFLPLVTHFSKVIHVYHTNTVKAVDAIFYGEEGTAQSVGTTELGQRYLLTKAMIQSSTALNLILYLLLKSEQQSANPGKTVDPALIQSHPVMLHLQKLDSFTKKLEESVESRVSTLREQLETIVKASELLNSPEITLSDEESVPEDADDSEIESDERAEGMDASANGLVDPDMQDTSDGDDDDDESLVDEETTRRTALTEARFGLRPMEIPSPNRIRRRNMLSDAGDEELENATLIKRAGQSLATTLNAIEQRTATQRQRQTRSTQQLVEHLDEPNDDELRRGLDMMEAELGKASDDEPEEMDENAFDPELDDEDNDDFYTLISKKSKATKEEKKRRYTVAPKFPRVESEIIGDRAVNAQIMKNRGLVAHKAKINRNPRVKKREQYRKAIIRRKGAVRDVRTGEAHQYAGEQTGIKTGVTRSRKLA